MLNLTKYCSSILTRNLRFPAVKYLYTCTPISITNVTHPSIRRNFLSYKDLLKDHYINTKGFASKSNQKSNKIVGNWLLTCSGMVFVAVVLGIVSYCFFYYCACYVIKTVIDETYGK